MAQENQMRSGWETNIFIRALDKDGNFRSLDIGDPDLPDAQLILWLCSKKNDYLIRLVLMLLGREVDGNV